MQLYLNNISDARTRMNESLYVTDEELAIVHKHYAVMIYHHLISLFFSKTQT